MGGWISGSLQSPRRAGCALTPAAAQHVLGAGSRGVIRPNFHERGNLATLSTVDYAAKWRTDDYVRSMTMAKFGREHRQGYRRVLTAGTGRPRLMKRGKRGRNSSPKPSWNLPDLEGIPERISARDRRIHRLVLLRAPAIV